MGTLLTVILVLFLIGYTAKLFFRYILPWWLTRFMHKQQRKYDEQFYTSRRINDEEEIRIKKEAVQGDINPDVGEYVDFEEIEDNE